VARTPRNQRRARRAEKAESKAKQGEPKIAQRARSRQQQVRPAAQPAKQQTGRREPAQARGRFARESWGELKKVEWPGRSQVIQGTIVVLIACAIVGAYLYVADQALSRVVEQILG
jgi:preprotein translocase subunit SecE